MVSGHADSFDLIGSGFDLLVSDVTASRPIHKDDWNFVLVLSAVNFKEQHHYPEITTQFLKVICSSFSFLFRWK